MNNITAIMDCINKNSSLVYNLAYRLTGEEEMAVNLIVHAAASLKIDKFDHNDILLLILSKICREYLKTSHKAPLSMGGRNPSGETLLQLLPPKEKIALVLHDVLKLPRQEVIEISGEPEPLLRTRLHQARNLVTDQYKKMFVDHPTYSYSLKDFL